MRLAQGPLRAVVADRPTRLYELVSDPDPVARQAAMQAMLPMRKIVVAELEAAADAAAVPTRPSARAVPPTASTTDVLRRRAHAGTATVRRSSTCRSASAPTTGARRRAVRDLRRLGTRAHGGVARGGVRRGRGASPSTSPWSRACRRSGWLDGAGRRRRAERDAVGRSARAPAATRSAAVPLVGGCTPPHLRAAARWAPLVAADLADDLAGGAAAVDAADRWRAAARACVTAHLDDRRWTARYHALRRARPPRTWVATHGEPHDAQPAPDRGRPAAGRLGVAQAGARASATCDARRVGRSTAADPEMLELFDLEWRLDEVAQYAAWFAAPHAGTEDDRTRLTVCSRSCTRER